MGLAGIKFSGSPNRKGVFVIRVKRIKAIIKIPKISFKVKNGWNGILSKLKLIPRGFLEPVK